MYFLFYVLFHFVGFGGEHTGTTKSRAALTNTITHKYTENTDDTEDPDDTDNKDNKGNKDNTDLRFVGHLTLAAMQLDI